MEHYNITGYHYTGTNHLFINQIIAYSNEAKKNKLVEKFFKLFYCHLPMKDLTEEQCKIYSELAESAFEFFSENSNSSTRVNLRDYKGAGDNAISILEINTKDKPFIVDSVTALLKRLNLNIIKITHPVINVTRDDNGKITDLYLPEESHNRSSNESLIQIHLSQLRDDEQKEKLIHDLRGVLSHVELAVQDWKVILSQLHEYTVMFKEFASIETGKSADFNERREFLESLESKYFVFLGATTYEFNDKNILSITNLDKGIINKQNKELKKIIEKSIFTGEFLSDENKEYIEIGKINQTSKVHREANMDYVCVKCFDEKGELSKATVFIGLFTSILYYQSATLIPIIRSKVSEILNKANLSSKVHSGKEIVGIIEAFPRDELFQIAIEELYLIVMEVFATLSEPELRFFARFRDGGQFINAMVFLPSERVTSSTQSKIEQILEANVGKVVVNNYMQLATAPLSYYHILISVEANALTQADFLKIESKLNNATVLWEDKLNVALSRERGKVEATRLLARYKNSFPESYKEKYIEADRIINDISLLQALEDNNFICKVVTVNDDACLSDIRIFSIKEISLYEIMPMIQNIGFKVENEHVFKIKNKNSSHAWIHSFIVRTDQCNPAAIQEVAKNIEETLTAMWQGLAQDDIFNNLILNAGLVYRQVSLLRAISKYLCQVNIGYSKAYMGKVLVSYPVLSRLLVDLFYANFDPSISTEERSKQVESISKLIEEGLGNVLNNVEDKIVRRFVEVVNNILRTNYFLTDSEGKHKDYISFKINSRDLPDLPLPKPFREIFVYSSHFEAIHLRSGKVARGGLRWSDRHEDFRTEVLGLMKAQVAKNSVIVPVGSKGGFVVKRVDGLTREEYVAKGIECYKKFLRGMLDITDNIVKGKLIRPQNVICKDEEDPYLVVAADKGTATFSDIANSVSAEYDFWLGDAFASGGSAGYDHKKMGITARGAWVSVMRHFRELGLDTQKEDFTVVGIGDMSGDVFGNGMLLSRHIRLLAAFNHMHIFVDPNPDAEASYIERERLFKLPRSTWLDYNKEIISKGGMVYERNAKHIELTPEIMERFNLTSNIISPDQFIKELLKSETDLLWNGGIGTYIKASTEENLNVGDKANDNLRIDGKDLRFKVVGEGGNLGCTQLGRIEFALKGGKINTDAIDNSAGVDCSDHEVNIKIVLGKAIEAKKLNIEQRDKILEEMTDEVAQLCLRDNQLQTQALTISEFQSFETMQPQERFIEQLEEKKILDRKLEGLPNKQEINRRHAEKIGLTRPELSVVLAYSKNSLYDNIINTSLPEDKFFEKELFNYFPERMRDDFKEEILAHPLKREIIATHITNSMVNRIATFYVHLTAEDTGQKFCDIARAYTITREVFDMRKLWEDIEALDGKVEVRAQNLLFLEAKKFIMRCSSWLLRNSSHNLDITKKIEEFSQGVLDLKKILALYLNDNIKQHVSQLVEEYTSMNIPKEIAESVAMLRTLSSAYNIVTIANRHKLSVEEVAKIYFSLGEVFKFDWLTLSASKLVIDNSWQRLSVRALKEELYDLHRRITDNIVEYTANSKKTQEGWYDIKTKYMDRYKKFINEISSYDYIEFSMLDLAIKRLYSILND